MAGVTGINIVLFILCCAGVGLSYYAYFVETAKESNEKYEPMCDINDKISCSKVFMSEYGVGYGVVGRYLGEKHILNQPNSVYGLVFYAVFALLSLTSSPAVAKIQLFLAFVSNCMSIYLAYLLYFVIHALCVVCAAVYVVNFFLLIGTVVKVKNTGKKLSKKAQKAEANKQKKVSKKNK